ncbi:hydroxymethylglutaryl-coenzyme A synthase C terminal-domain-containing protein [Zopfochytrium polystomum]|nr:hydroxymethylglutaryl-coenzyme A synthase C terminal-domain-containing protein [Zopfochytrium polystomum]
MLTATTTPAPSQTPASRNVGIHAIELYIPKKFVNQAELEQFDGVSTGKYTIGLGQTNMSVCDDREDINSICLTAVHHLLEKHSIPPTAIGFLEVGTETIIDKSKSVKTVLMELFASAGNHDIEGVDTKNACYGGTNALFHAIEWLESSYAEEGKYAIVVAADIAVYKSGGARPTGGAGAVAMLVGRDAPVVFDQGLRATYMDHQWDFYKPDLHSEYPEVDGPLSNSTYIKALDNCYQLLLSKFARKTGVAAPTSETIGDFYLFHTPYAKLVQKAFGRIAFNDYVRNPADSRFATCVPAKMAGSALEETYTDKEIEKTFVECTKSEFSAKVLPGLLASKNCGNMYCGSLYAALASLLSEVPSASLLNKRLVLFSYGSGLAASMFTVTVRGPTDSFAASLHVKDRLAARTKVEPASYDAIMALREGTHNARNYTPVSDVKSPEAMFPGTYYLEAVDAKFRRTYKRWFGPSI